MVGRLYEFTREVGDNAAGILEAQYEITSTGKHLAAAEPETTGFNATQLTELFGKPEEWKRFDPAFRLYQQGQLGLGPRSTGKTYQSSTG